MAPVAAYLAGDPACAGQIIFSAGLELSLIGPPRLIESFAAERTQLARCANDLQPDLLDVFGVAVEAASAAGQHPLAELAAWLVRSDQAKILRGAELFARPG